MCGVFGWFALTRPLREEDVRSARRATALLNHRGPDSQGEWQADRVFMGHRRLKIIDLSAAADQPFHGPEGQHVLCYNGEIYNYIELRDELGKLGRVFKTSSDTEVLIQAFAEWGDGALTRLDGMFAGALHDRARRRHIIFRDPLGQKSLYYFLSADHLIYASELRSLLALDAFRWRIDRQSVAAYLANGYFAGASTPIAGIRKLLPGHVLVASDGKVRTDRYWHSVPGDGLRDRSEADALRGADERIAHACRTAMRSDVRFGVFLSGGIDSSLILSYCRELDPNVQAVSLAMGERDFDESAKAEAVAKQLAIRRHTVVTMDERAVAPTLETLFAMNDEPHGDPGFINARFLAEAAKNHFTVALAGDGGDELFYGYAPFHALRFAPLLGRLPSLAVAACRWAPTLLPTHDGYLGTRMKLEALLRGFPAPDGLYAPLWLAAMSPEEMRRLLPSCQGYFDRTGKPETFLSEARDLMAPLGGRSPAQRLAYFYQQRFLPEFVCMHTDRAAMQVALEVRSPLLSPTVIAFANSLPDHLKYRHGQDKWLLRRLAATRGIAPAIARQRKQGFTLPLARWLKTCLRPSADALLRPERWEGDRDLVDPGAVAALAAAHQAGKANNYRILFNLMSFRAWRDRYGSLEWAD